MTDEEVIRKGKEVYDTYRHWLDAQITEAAWDYPAKEHLTAEQLDYRNQVKEKGRQSKALNLAHLHKLLTPAEPSIGPVPRKPEEIVHQTNELAAQLYHLRGYAVVPGYRFDGARHPHEREAWRGACVAQELLTQTDPEDALEESEAHTI